MVKATQAIKGARVAKAADKRGARPGSARANQSVKLSAEDKAQLKAEAASRKSDVIKEVKGVTSGGNYTVVTAPGYAALYMKDNVASGATRKAAVPGGSFKAVTAMYKADEEKARGAKLARGIDGRNSPHSAKSVADRHAAAAKGKAPKGEKAAKVAKAAKAPKGDDTQKLVITKKDFTFGGEGTARRGSWDAAVAVAKVGGTAADYVARGGKAKYLARWEKAGAIKLS